MGVSWSNFWSSQHSRHLGLGQPRSVKRRCFLPPHHLSLPPCRPSFPPSSWCPWTSTQPFWPDSARQHRADSCFVKEKKRLTSRFQNYNAKVTHMVVVLRRFSAIKSTSSFGSTLTTELSFLSSLWPLSLPWGGEVGPPDGPGLDGPGLDGPALGWSVFLGCDFFSNTISTSSLGSISVTEESRWRIF